MMFNDTNSKFANYESIGSLLTGKTSTNFLCTNFLLSKGGIASVKGFSNYQSIPTQYINFYYNSAISALEIYIITGNGNDVGGGVTSSFVSQKIGYIKYTVDSVSQGTINIPTAILPPLKDISGLSADILTLNNFKC